MWRELHEKLSVAVVLHSGALLCDTATLASAHWVIPPAEAVEIAETSGRHRKVTGGRSTESTLFAPVRKLCEQ